MWRERGKKATNSQWAKAKAQSETTTTRIKRKGVDPGNADPKKVATVGKRLDVGSEKDSGETKITLGFLVGRSTIGYFPLQWKTGQIGKMSSFLP